MKKSISVILSLVLLLMAVCLAPLTEASAETAMVEVTKNASIRSKPGFDGDKIILAKAGSQYLYLGTEGSWYAIQMDNGKTGYLPQDSCRLTAAPGIPTRNAKDTFSSMINTLKKQGKFEPELPDVFYGKTAIGVYYDLDGKPEELSTEILAEEQSYWSIPVELLAENIGEADWALLVYPEITGEEDDPIRVNVFAADLRNSVFYAPYTLEDRETRLENDERSYEMDPTLRGMKEFVFYSKWEAAFRLANDEDYQEGLRLMKEERYFSAYEAFRRSDLDEAAEMAEKCVQKWPRTGEIWHNSSVKGSNMQLTVQVNQPDDRAMLIRIYTKGVQAACLFIGGTGKATAKLPAGTYTIKDGVGTEWYGLREAFGRYAAYETMTFDDYGTTEVKLQSGHAYTITVNVSDIDPNADSVGSEYQDWEGFAE